MSNILDRFLHLAWYLFTCWLVLALVHHTLSWGALLSVAMGFTVGDIALAFWRHHRSSYKGGRHRAEEN